MVQSGYGYILCQIYMVADGCRADNGVAQSDSGIFPDNQVAYSIVQTRKILHYRILPEREEIEWGKILAYATVNHRAFSTF